MKAEGSLAEDDLASLLQNLYHKRWSGLLTLTRAGVGKSIRVQEGRMVFASSSSADDRLGELLLRQGRLTLPQFVGASKAIVPGRRLGTVLVEHGVLTPAELVEAVVEQAREIIYSVFLWTEGHYRLQEGPPSEEEITLSMSTPDLIMEGIRRIDAWSRIDAAVGGVDARYARAADYEEVIAQMTLSLEKLDILTSLHQPRSVVEICDDSTLHDFEVCQVLWGFTVVGVVRRIDAPGPTRAASLEMEDDGLGMVLPSE